MFQATLILLFLTVALATDITRNDPHLSASKECCDKINVEVKTSKGPNHLKDFQGTYLHKGMFWAGHKLWLHEDGQKMIGFLPTMHWGIAKLREGTSLKSSTSNSPCPADVGNKWMYVEKDTGSWRHFGVTEFLIECHGELIELRNASQMDTETRWGCASAGCQAGHALDGNPHTWAITKGSQISWWSAEMTISVKITKVFIYTNQWAVDGGNFKRFKVETRMSDVDPWKVCKEEYSITGQENPYVVRCARPNTAKFLKLEVRGPGNVDVKLYLAEVKVYGIAV